MTIKLFLQMFKPGGFFAPGLGGGGGSTTSTSEQTTNNTDARIVGGENSTNASVNNSSGNTITITDSGAVAGALDLARTSLTTSQTVASAAMGTTEKTFEGALDAVSDAYETAKAGDQKIVAIAGMAVVGLAAAALLLRSK
jgi:hypothetical protein